MDIHRAHHQSGRPEPLAMTPARPTGSDAAPPPFAGASEASQAIAADRETALNEDAYWQENLRLLGGLMAIWFAVSFGAGILFREFLDQFMLGGYPLGFWFAQQGSIYVFIALIFFYSWRMKQIERKYDLDD